MEQHYVRVKHLSVLVINEGGAFLNRVFSLIIDKSNKTIWHQQTAVITLFATTFCCLIPFPSTSLFWNITLKFLRNFPLHTAIQVSEIIFGKKTVWQKKKSKEKKKIGQSAPLISTTTSMMTRAGSKFPLFVRKQNRKSNYRNISTSSIK